MYLRAFWSETRSPCFFRYILPAVMAIGEKKGVMGKIDGTGMDAVLKKELIEGYVNGQGVYLSPIQFKAVKNAKPAAALYDGELAKIWADPKKATRACRIANEGMAKFCAANPGRFLGVALLPTTNEDALMQEYRHAIDCLGLVGSVVFVGPDGVDRAQWLYP